MLKIRSLEKLVHELNRLPGIGPKTAQRLAYYVLRTPDFSEKLQAALENVVQSVHLCTQCFSYTDEPEICRYCSDSSRREDLICVVEEPSDIERVESSGAYRGRYHVLHGALSPLDNVGPKDLRIREFLERIEDGIEGKKPLVTEVILALDPDLEGDTTVLYLAKELEKKSLKITRIASGVPIGSDIEYVDDRTLGRALENRIQI
jgi:recombination protein RecR